MPRPMWSGSISFGLINVPVKLFNATRKKTLQFHQLRASDSCRIRLRRVCPVDGAEVSAENIVKGFEISPERYVVVTDDELSTISPKSTKTIDIQDFVRLDEIDPLYYDHSYYLVPDKGAGKAYSLLLAAMKKAEKTAIVKFVMHSKEYLGALRPVSDALLTLSTMYFHEEVVPLTELADVVPDTPPPSERELAMAEQLIETLTVPFAPEKYKDEFRQQIMGLIEKKAEGEMVTAAPAPREQGKVIDLMSALEASLAAIKQKQAVPAAKGRSKKARAQ